jgi:hypothetical protein
MHVSTYYLEGMMVNSLLEVLQNVDFNQAVIPALNSVVRAKMSSVVVSFVNG